MVTLRRGLPVLAAAGLLLAAVPLRAATPEEATSGDPRFYEAYYLEHEVGDVARAAELYGEIAGDPAVPESLRAEARVHREGCLEELVSSDFARLMRPETIVYAEFNRPGGQLLELARALGLVRGDDVTEASQRFAVSPRLFSGVLGIRGAALSITGFDMSREMPRGVLVAHPGDIDVIRGIIETALPAAAQPVDPVRGFPTYRIEDRFYVTITRRLLVAALTPGSIEGVVERLQGERTASVATESELAETLQGRENSLLYVGVNFKRLMPVVQPMLAVASTQSREARLAQALLDLRSLRTLTARVDVSGEGLALDLDLDLDDGHRNLVFNLFRQPAVDPTVVRAIPRGAAGFVVTALNELRPGPVGIQGEADEVPPVSLQDIGRELYSNIVGLALFAMETSDEELHGHPLPGVAAALTVNDPEKTEALWAEFLGIASCASGAGASIEGRAIELGSARALAYPFPDGITVYLARVGNRFVITPSRQVLSSALAVAGGAPSVYDDAAFAPALVGLDPSATVAAFLSPKRLLEIAQPHMSRHERAELAPILPLLEPLVGAVTVAQSATQLQVNARLTGVPRVGPILSWLMEEEMHLPHRSALGDRLQPQAAPQGGAHPAPSTTALGEGL